MLVFYGSIDSFLVKLQYWDSVENDYNLYSSDKIHSEL